MPGLKIPLPGRPSTSKNRFVYAVRPGGGPRCEQPQPIEEPQVTPEPTLTEKIADCQRRIFGFTSRGCDVPFGLTKELEALLTEAANVKAP